MITRRKRISHDPCAGCGSKEGHLTNEVCDTCRELMADGKKYREHLKRVVKSGERELYQLPNRGYALAGYHHVNFERRDELTAAMHAMALTVTDTIDDSDDASGFSERGAGSTAYRVFDSKWDGGRRAAPFFTVNRGGEWKSYVLAHPLVRTALDNLDHEVRLSLHFAYWRGVKAGWSLLRQVKSGEMTLASAEEHTTREREALVSLCKSLGMKMPKRSSGDDYEAEDSE